MSQDPAQPAKKGGLLKKILIGIAVVILLFIVVVAMQPSDFRITRSATIAAPPDVVFAQVNDFHNWDAWSPWAKLDPTVKNSFDGAASGTGAKFSWAGNDKVGEGRMTIIDSHPSDLVKIKLEFIKPFEATNTAEFNFKEDDGKTKPEDRKTVVSWSMYGPHSFIEKAVCMFMNMDKMVGGDFEKGLAQLKTVSENAAAKK